ncbi:MULTISPECIES: hypothetical protein [Yersinia]|uniref:hypothetical protein n=1 Tax=Yersinia TaxID=629 RepID=UPI0009B701B0|nr:MULTISPECIES: hypothetical protein [Yersinia]ARB83649.1 hypothetical protein A6J67_06025 [Yersinia sp. FDAARGOS_228]AVL37430.1 hypothetical protein CEQ36_18775 [Yersinia intermedia]MDN0104126.1 hypothetical protein [Yersinia bercovieri]
MLKPYPLSKQDSYAWALAIVLPLLWAPFAIFFPKEIALGFYLVLSLVWTLLDRLSLMKQEKVPPSFGYFLLPMVYLRQRDERQGKPWRLLQVWLICTVLSVIAGEQFKKQSGTEQLAQSACSIVTQLMKQEGIDERCIRVTDLKEEVSGRFYRAQALMNTGNKEPMTIEVRGRDIYVVLPEWEE